MLADQAGKSPSLHGNILDLVAKRERKMNQAQKPLRNTNTSVARTEIGEAPKYFQPFVPDIDNFGGVKIIKNYCLIALKDNGYGLGERSVGVL